MIPKTQATKENIDQLHLIKMKHFGASKDTIIKKVKRIHRIRIAVNHISDKGLVPRIYKEP